MSKIDKILSEVYKNEVNLESQEVYLNLVQDMEKLNKELIGILKTSDKAWRDYQNYLTRADVPFKAMIKNRDILGKIIISTEQKLSKTEKDIKSIGLDINEVLPIYKGMKSNIVTANEILNTINSFDDPSSFQ